MERIHAHTYLSIFLSHLSSALHTHSLTLSYSCLYHFLSYSSCYGSTKGKSHRVLRTLWHVAAPNFVPAGVCQLITVFVQVAIPLMVRELLIIIERNPNESVIDQALLWAILIFVGALVNSMASQRHRHLATKAGIAMRAAIIRVVYDNAIQMTPSGKRGLTSGEVTNIVAVDTQKVRIVGHWTCG